MSVSASWNASPAIHTEQSFSAPDELQLAGDASLLTGHVVDTRDAEQLGEVACVHIRI